MATECRVFVSLRCFRPANSSWRSAGLEVGPFCAVHITAGHKPALDLRDLRQSFLWLSEYEEAEKFEVPESPDRNRTEDDSGETKSSIGLAESVQPELAVDRPNFGRLD